MTQQSDDAGPDRDSTTSKNADDRSSKLFDLRILIGGLFTFYGVVLIIASFFIGTEKSNNIDINLWLGLGMGVLGVLFLAWARWRPLDLRAAPSAATATEAEPPPT